MGTCNLMVASETGRLRRRAPKNDRRFATCCHTGTRVNTGEGFPKLFIKITLHGETTVGCMALWQFKRQYSTLS